jgi:hypothetical protein
MASCWHLERTPEHCCELQSGNLQQEALSFVILHAQIGPRTKTSAL